MFLRTESVTEYARMYPAVSFLAMLQLIFFIIMQFPIIPHTLLFQALSAVNLQISEGEYWRLFTSIFVHVSLSHVLLNTCSLTIIGPLLEKACGKLGFLLLYIGLGITANLTTLAIEPLYYSHAGASGSVFGLLGVCLAFSITGRTAFPVLDRRLVIPLIAAALLTAFIQPNINQSAHIGGLGAGYLTGIALLKLRKHFN